MRTLQRDQNMRTTVTGRVTNGGAIISGTGFIVTKVGTGAYIIRVPRGTIIGFNATAEASAYYISAAYLQDNSTLWLGIFNSTTGTATDVAFSFNITVLDKS